MNKRINSLEGIRTLACISVFLCHFRGAFAPNTVFWFDNTPLRIFTSGNVVVRILFVLSGFVISNKHFCSQSCRVNTDILKRYFRLAPNIIAANLLVYILMICGLMYNVEAAGLSGSQDFLALFNNFIPNLSLCLREALFTCYFTGANAYIGPLWTIVYEFLGSIMVLVIIGLCKENQTLRFLTYFLILFAFNSYYNYFILGMIVSELYVEGSIIVFLRSRKGINFVLFIIAFIGVCMIQIDDMNKMTRILFGVCLVLFFLTILGSSLASKILGNKVMLKGGMLSYSIYIVHWPVIESFSSWCYIKFYSTGIRLDQAVLINLILTSVIIIIVAALFHKYFENAGLGAIKYIENRSDKL